ncbi:hypothetical protein AYK25_09945 [Thermoplasmatales archaeon SM1-50]|nr:MAG: hypothetical protein AYK25_09945 [Thermoplasmatales archaeon SM1-50]
MKYDKEEKTKKIFELYEKGLKPKEIAAVMHITEQYVRRILNRGYPIPTIKNSNLNASTPVLSPYEPQINPPHPTRVSGYIHYPIQPSPDASLLRKNQQLEKALTELEKKVVKLEAERDKYKKDFENLSHAFSQKNNENEILKQKNETFEHRLTEKDQQNKKIEKSHYERYSILKECFEKLLVVCETQYKELKMTKEENYNFKLRELQRKKEEDISKIINVKQIPKPSPENTNNQLLKPMIKEIESTEENNILILYVKIGLAALVFLCSFYKGYVENKDEMYRSLSKT